MPLIMRSRSSTKGCSLRPMQSMPIELRDPVPLLLSLSGSRLILESRVAIPNSEAPLSASATLELSPVKRLRHFGVAGRRTRGGSSILPTGTAHWEARQVVDGLHAEQKPLEFVYIPPPFSTVSLPLVHRYPGASFSASHGESKGVEGIERRVVSVSY